MNSINFHCSTVSDAYSVEDQRVVYSRVVFQNVLYYVQISRPAHPYRYYEVLDNGADIRINTGHIDNDTLDREVEKAGLDWDEIVSEILSRSDAEAELDRILTADC